MDQDSFRKLLQAPKASTSSAPASRSTSSAHGKKAKAKNADPAQPAFKPRTVKKLDLYRDRAGERRQGLGNDYAQVEALAEDFEKRNADKDRETLEEQRKYLGGDSEHTVLVKGLDFALLEQNKARLAEESTVDDDVLEQAFAEGVAQAPKKRSRADIINELKNKRVKTDGESPSPAPEAPLDDVKKTGKFKPIGFKPIGGDKPKKKKKKAAEGASKVPAQPTPASAASAPGPSESTRESVPASSASKRTPPPFGQEPMDEDDDIFAGAGDYAGIEVGDDEDDASDAEPSIRAEREDVSDGEIAEAVPRRWVDIDEGPVLPPKSTSPERAPSAPPPRSASLERRVPDDEEEEQHARLQPLASSAVPSIRELLAIDEAKEREAKRRARREKKKGKKSAGDDSE